MTQVYRPQLVPSGNFRGSGTDSSRCKMKGPGTGHAGHQTDTYSISSIYCLTYD